MGFINFRGGQKDDSFAELSAEAKKVEQAENEAFGSMKRRRIAADYFGVPEMAERDNTAVLSEILIRRRALVEIYDKLTGNNNLVKEYDATQLMNDFWLSSVAEIIDQGKLSPFQKEKCLQLLITAMQVNNQTSAKQHYLFMERNEEYRKYINRCFGLEENGLPLVWLWIEHLGNQALPEGGRHGKNRMDTVMYFMKEYVSYMLLLSFYINQLFPGHGCGKKTKTLLESKFELISAGMTGEKYLEFDVQSLINPIYYDSTNYSTEYKGFEQSKNQSEGLKNAFASFTRSLGQSRRVLNIIRLLDACSESGNTNLEGKYEMIKKEI